MKRIPIGVDPQFEPVWRAFLDMKAVQQLEQHSSDTVVEECFRLLIKQTGERVKLQLGVSDFCDAKCSEVLRQMFRKYGLNRNCKTWKHERRLEYESNPTICVALNPTIVGTVVLTCGTFGLKYVLSTLDDRLWRNRPLSVMDKYPDGRPKTYKTYKKLGDRDFHQIIEQDHVVLSVARTDQHLVFRYRLQLAAAVPLYPRFDYEMKRILTRTIQGVFP